MLINVRRTQRESIEISISKDTQTLNEPKEENTKENQWTEDETNSNENESKKIKSQSNSPNSPKYGGAYSSYGAYSNCNAYGNGNNAWYDN